MYVVLFLNIKGIVILIVVICMNGFNVEYEKKMYGRFVVFNMWFDICLIKKVLVKF